nr:MAG TPA: hypothetical protein [Caudoviricetes sp.]
MLVHFTHPTLLSRKPAVGKKSYTIFNFYAWID